MKNVLKLIVFISFIGAALGWVYFRVNDLEHRVYVLENLLIMASPHAPMPQAKP